MAGVKVVPATTTAQEIATEERKAHSTLTTFQASADNDEHHTDRVEALRLIADSVAQQRQNLSRAIITNPIAIVIALAVCAIAIQYNDDLATAVITTAGFLMAGMAGVGYFTYEYLDLAEKTGTWSYLRGDDNKEDILLVTKYNDAIIGALVLRLSPVSGTDEDKQNNDKNKSTKLKAIIRAWTVSRRYRKMEIGTDLLQEAITLCKKNGWEGPEFAPEHANSKRVLPRMFHKNMDRMEAKAQKLLERLKANDSKN